MTNPTLSDDINEGQPGEYWKVVNRRLYYAEAIWYFLEGENLARAHELGYEGDRLLICIHSWNEHVLDYMPGGGYIAPDGLYGLGTFENFMRYSRTEDEWTKLQITGVP